MGFGYSNWPTYIAQYQTASSDWQADQGPSVDNCQYYQGSSLAIWIKLGESSLRGGECGTVARCRGVAAHNTGDDPSHTSSAVRLRLTMITVLAT
jgi:hypothetical protein